MVEQTRSNVADDAEEDLSGRSRFLANVLASWVGQLVLIALGFIVPRLIDHQVGQFALGVWDFCWSLVNYLNLVSLGMGSAVNRYVARFRGRGEWAKLNEAIASVAWVQIAISAAILATVAVIVWAIPVYFAERLGAETETARWVVAFLGASYAVQMLFDPWRGVITGCHRWDVYNVLNVGYVTVASAGMIVALMLGYGLQGMSVVYFAVTCVTELLRVRIGKRICVELTFDLRLATREVAANLVRFGLKSVLAHVPAILAIQTTSLVVVAALGPASLAILSRPMALVRHALLFVEKFAMVLTPTASFIQGTGRTHEIADFLLSSTRFGVALTAPIIAFLAINGDWLLRIWMGEAYVHHVLIAVLSGGYFLTIAQSSVMRVMIGLDEHGKIAAISVLLTISGLGVGIALLWSFGWSLVGAALLASIPLAIARGVVVPWLSCRRLDVHFGHYLLHCFGKPLAISAVFSLLLVLGRQLPAGHPVVAIVISTLVASAVLAYAYWRYLLTADNRKVVLQHLPARVRRSMSV